MKVQFNKLGLKLNNPVTTIEINGQTVEIKQYLPAQEKLDMISEILNKSVDAQRPYFYDPGKYTIYMDINLIKHYTNITFTEKQLEDPSKLYDIIWSNEDIANDILGAIPQSEIRQIHQWAQIAMNAITAHTQSALGILESISSDYNQLNLDADKIKEKITDPASLDILKEIAPFLDQKG